MSQRAQNKGLTGLLNKLDFTRECYVLMSRDQRTVLLDGASGQPWHTYHKSQALNMQAILRNEDGIETALVTFTQALCHLASLEGVKIHPPFTMKNIADQLIDSARPKQHAIPFDSSVAGNGDVVDIDTKADADVSSDTDSDKS